MLLGPSFIHKDSVAGKAWAGRSVGVKAMDDPTPLTYARDDAIRVFRVYFKDQSPDVARAPFVANTILEKLGGYRHPNLYCEIYVGIPRLLLPAYFPLFTEVTRWLRIAGLKVCGPSSYTGDYDAEEFQKLRDEGFCGFDAISVQCYWGNQGFTLDHALRYRTVYKPGDPPYFIVECGFDEVEGGKAGWKKMGKTPLQVAQSLMAYDLLVEQDHYVKAIFPYVLGPTPDWEDFNLEEVAPLIPGGNPMPDADYSPAIYRPVANFGYPGGAHGRQGHQPVACCFHIMQGYLVNCFAEFNDPAKDKSAQYGVGKAGRVEQFVLEADASWGAGDWDKPDLHNRFIADAVGHGVRANLIVENIELEGFSGDFMPEPQYQSLLALTRSIFTRHGWPAKDLDRYIGHFQVDSVTRKDDPGSGFPWARLQRDMAGIPTLDLTPELVRLYTLEADLSKLVADIKGKVGA